ncbi:MAG: NUDIX domain-containing protein [Aggregatilineales bacterium]
MHGIGVHVAVIRENEVLLIQRKDFEVWGLPSGEIEAGETPAQAAIRETLEETGLTVQLTRLVGLYTIPQMPLGNKTNAVFAAEIVSGRLENTTDETLNAAFFTLEALPESLIWWSRQRIIDALTGIGGSAVRTQNVHMPAGNLSRQELYRQRDDSGLSPVDFFQNTFPKESETTDI